jgi:putative flippase GtrA
MSASPHIAPGPSTLARWCRFNLVGGMGIVVQFGSLFLLKSLFGFNYLVATMIAVEAAIVHNFMWHEQFTWADRIRNDRIRNDRIGNNAIDSRTNRPCWPRSLKRFFRFNVTTGAVSLLGNLALMKVMVGRGHMNYLLANAIAIVLCSAANFLVSDEWVFEE